jgi:hypothetical protein
MRREPDEMSSPAIFFDLWGTLLRTGPRVAKPQTETTALLASLGGYRLGVLANAGSNRSARDVRRLLEAAGIAHYFDPALIVVASDLPTPLPDRRAFAVAAALAASALGDCVFVSRNTTLLIAAAAAGMRTVPAADLAGVMIPSATRDVESDRSGPGLLSDDTAPSPVVGATLMAGEVDEDIGPTFVLRGRIVTMDGNPIEDGRIVIRKGLIVSVAPATQPLPADLAGALQVDTGGTIYPGLLDLHNHFAYNVLPLWVVPRRSDGRPFSNRSQWPRHREYRPNVTEPLSLMSRYSPTAEAIVRYVEAKAIVGGTTTGQGIRGRSGSLATPAMYHGAMRNVEETDDPRLPEAGSMILNLKSDRPGQIASFRRALQTRRAYFYHLSEGVDEEARSHYLNLAANDLVQQSLVGIHALGLQEADLRKLSTSGAKIVWSPYSNQLLYNQSVDPGALKRSEVLFAIGCDWTPTGSKNLLFELKVARFFARQNPAAGLSSADLVRAVTVDAARVAGWHEHLGRLRAGAMADLLVIAGKDGDPYEHLIDATERDVALVVIHGIPRYGDAELFDLVHASPTHAPESLTLGNRNKRFHSFTPGSQINHVSLSTAISRLEEAMGDLPAFQERVTAAGASLLAMGMEDDDGFTLVLDNEYDPTGETPVAHEPGPMLLAPVELPEQIELDGLEASGGTYWDRVGMQPNLPVELKEELKNAYR